MKISSQTLIVLKELYKMTELFNEHQQKNLDLIFNDFDCSFMKPNNNSNDIQRLPLQYNIQIISMQGGSKISLEQDLMKNQLSPIILNKRAHNNSIESAAVHPNFKTLATGSHDHSIKLWDVQTFKETQTLLQHKQGVWSLDYSKDGNLLVSGSADGGVILWDTKKYSPGIKFSTHKSKVYATKFNESSKLLGTCGEGGQIFIWDLAKTKQPLKRIQINSLIAYDFQWSGTEDSFFVTTYGSKLLAYETKSFNQISSHDVTENVHDSKCESIAVDFKQIPGRLYCGTDRGKIAWYEFRNNVLVKETQIPAHLDSVRTVKYHPSKKIILSTGRDGSAKLWNASSSTHHPSILGNLAHHLQNIPATAFVGDDLIVTGSWDQSLALWSIKELIK